MACSFLLGQALRKLAVGLSAAVRPIRTGNATEDSGAPAVSFQDIRVPAAECSGQLPDPAGVWGGCVCVLEPGKDNVSQLEASLGRAESRSSDGNTKKRECGPCSA